MLCDNSMLSAYAKCQLYHHIRYERHRAYQAYRPRLDLGTAVHEFFDAYTSGTPLQPILAKWMEHFSHAPLHVSPSETDHLIAQFTSACTELTNRYPLITDANSTRLILAPTDRSP